RVNKGGQPTFDAVLAAIARLKKHAVEFNTLTVVNRKNSYHPLDVYQFLRETGSGYMQFIPIVERIASAPGPDGLHLISPTLKTPPRSPNGPSSRCSSENFCAPSLTSGSAATSASPSSRSST